MTSVIHRGGGVRHLLNLPHRIVIRTPRFISQPLSVSPPFCHSVRCFSKASNLETKDEKVDSKPKSDVIPLRSGYVTNVGNIYVFRPSSQSGECLAPLDESTRRRVEEEAARNGIGEAQTIGVPVIVPSDARILPPSSRVPSDEDIVENSEPVPTQSVSEHMWRGIGSPVSSDTPLWKHRLQAFSALSKVRLSALVVTTALAGFGMAPSPSFDLSLMTACLLGTGLTSAAANTVNQILEVPYDSQMNRTKNRPLVRGAVTVPQAATFGLVSASVGLSLLYWGTNPLTCCLGALNLLLYTSCYTPMKRTSVANTWLGSLVGAIPPMMGWTAVTGSMDPGAWLMGGILLCWQFPHFKALSWNLRGDYSRAGYRMSSVLNPAMCTRVSLRHSLALIPLCTLASATGVTSWFFAVESLPVNLFLVYTAWQFHRKRDSASSRRHFRYTLVHLPLLLLLMYLSKGEVWTPEWVTRLQDQIKQKVYHLVVASKPSSD